MGLTFPHGFVRFVAIAAVGLAPLACQVSAGGAGGGGSGGTGGGKGAVAVAVGTPCTPGVEYNPRFFGFRITEDVIEADAPECGGGVCLINHFQGDVSCPLGQAAPVDADGHLDCVPGRDANGQYVPGQGSCKPGDQCVEAGSLSPRCDVSDSVNADKFCAGLGAGGKCGASGYCECVTDADCAFINDAVVTCDPQKHQCVEYACHKPGDCQQAEATDAENAGKACCLPGTDVPVVRPVCGQCEGSGGVSTRGADSAVYCSCRCGVSDGDTAEPGDEFCACPDGFECSEVRKNIGLGDARYTGKYCIKAGTAYQPDADQCGSVDGYWSASGDASCAGVATGQCTTSGGPCSN